MIKRFSTNYAIFSMVLDGLLVLASLRVAQLIRPHLEFVSQWIRDVRSVPPVSLTLYILFPLVWLVVYLQYEIYNPEKNLQPSDEFFNLMIASLSAATIIAGILFLTERELSRVLFLSFALITTLVLLFHRMAYRLLVQRGVFKRGKRQRILIVGAGVVGRRLAEAIEAYRPLGFDIVGFVDDDPELLSASPDILGTLDQTAQILMEREIENIVIALPNWAHSRMNELIGHVHKMPVRVWVIPDYFALALNQATILEFAGFPMVDLRAPALTTLQRFVKRIFDLAIALPGFMLTLPIFGLIALLIKLDSPGPVLYFSPRMKENGETFNMIKFRTMTQQADQQLQHVMVKDKDGNLIHKRPDDPRVTSIGKFLRKTSLDELPQLMNILRGDMSLVGPRPELPDFVDRYEDWQRRRFAVPQGLTGWWQVNGRSDKPMHLHTEEDIYYIQHYSIWLDIQILLKTVWIVLRGKGAY